jgi:hypothetical protein
VKVIIRREVVTEMELTVRDLADAFCSLDDESQAQFFIECAAIAAGWPKTTMPSGPTDAEFLALSDIYFRAAGLGLKEFGWLDKSGALAIYRAGRSSRDAEVDALRAELAVLRDAARQVPIAGPGKGAQSCSFCGKPPAEVCKLVANETGTCTICEECVSLVVPLMLLREPKPPAPVAATCPQCATCDGTGKQSPPDGDAGEGRKGEP